MLPYGHEVRQTFNITTSTCLNLESLSDWSVVTVRNYSAISWREQ